MPFASHIQASALAACAVCGILLSLPLPAERPVNDHMFRAAESARSAIDFDERGFLINGHRTFIVSAGMEYARVPRELWRDRLLRLKRGGFNAVEIYTFWNFHEPREGQFDFSGDHDLNAFLQLAHELDLYVIARVGPYYCAEWEQGGYPIWLRFKKDVEVRKPNAEFEKYVDRFFDKLIPIVAANQISRGGSVILVQLENEHPDGWGTDMPNSYFTHLRDKALSLGLEVPYFFSGLHHGNDPAGEAGSLDDPNRPNPWFSTEFWSVWFNQYGPQPTDAAVFGRRAWKMIAHGGNGYNVYMGHGGTNFGYSNDHEDAASYDYGAAVGQAGDLRPLYYSFKRAAWFARSFADVLENSKDATAEAGVKLSNSLIKVAARRGPEGTILFLDNPTNSEQETEVELTPAQTRRHAHILLAPSEIMPLVSRVPLTDGVTIDWSDSRLLGTAIAGATVTLVPYGAPGSTASFDFSTSATPQIQVGRSAFTADGAELHLAFSFHEGQPGEYQFSVGPKRIRILAVSQDRADATWFVDLGKDTCVIFGPAYLGEAQIKSGRLHLDVERPWENSRPEPGVSAYGRDAAPLPFLPLRASPARGNLKNNALQAAHPASLHISTWQTASAAQPASVQFDGSMWKKTEEPEQMGADGDFTADAWYRSALNLDHAGSYLLRFDHGGDRATLFVDGALRGSAESTPPEFLVDLSAGSHSIAVFTAHNGRNKLYNYLGRLDATDQKGLGGSAEVWSHAVVHALSWRTVSADLSDKGASPQVPALGSPAWREYHAGEGGSHSGRGLAWFVTTIQRSAAQHSVLEVPGANQDLTLFLNGKKLGSYPRWGKSFLLNLDADLQSNSIVNLAIRVHSHDGADGIDKRIRLVTYDDATPVQGWCMRGGPGSVQPAEWRDLRLEEHFQGPQFFRTTFDAPVAEMKDMTSIWRVVVSDMGHGNVWVNGHDLGRYPERIPVEGFYIPECWLKPTNTLEIYDEDGQVPGRVSVQLESAASRFQTEYVAQ